MTERNIGGLWCSEVAAQLEPYVAQRLPADVKARVEAHVVECELCASFGDRYARLIHEVRRLAAESEPDAALIERIQHRLSSNLK